MKCKQDDFWSGVCNLGTLSCRVEHEIIEVWEKGYRDAIDDVEEAMRLATVHDLGPAGLRIYNDPAIFVHELQRLRAKRPK